MKKRQSLSPVHLPVSGGMPLNFLPTEAEYDSQNHLESNHKSLYKNALSVKHTGENITNNTKNYSTTMVFVSHSLHGGKRL